MNTHEFQEVDASEEELIFSAALAHDDPLARLAFLCHRCGTNGKLLERLVKLFAAHETDPQFLNNTARFHSELADSFDESPGTIVGNYRLERLLGSGSFGDVYEAVQSEPVRRRVALKLLKPGLENGSVLARFEAERQALAMMEHPNIARLLDAGLTIHGRPWFAMELIQGVPITEYSAARDMPVSDRLEMFIDVCEAVQHAHQKAVIHRDLKPANVLVSEADAKPVPRIIDFGIAKAIGGEGLEQPTLTQKEQVVGTPLYMSPEQTEFGAVGIDTRTDVYSLGVLLYELLTGTTPFLRQRFQNAGFNEIRKVICEEVPARPSHQVAASGPTDDSPLARVRRSNAQRLQRALRGDLDWIVMKCLEKDRSRRYQSVGDLARDLRRFLNHEAVEAGPPSRRYRWSKFARQHRGLIAATGSVLLVLVAATAFSIWQAVRATRARNAEALQTRATAKALELAEREREVAVVTNSFLLRDLLGQASIRNQSVPEQRNRDLTVAELLDRAVARLETGGVGLESVEGALRTTIGQAYIGLGRYPEADRQLTAAWEIQQRRLGPESPETRESILYLCDLRLKQNRLDEVALLLESLKENFRSLYGEEHPETLKVSELETGYLESRGQFRKARDLAMKIVETRQRVLPEDDPETLRGFCVLAHLHLVDGEFEQAERLARQAHHGLAQQKGFDHPATLDAGKILSNALLGQKRWEEAGNLYKTSLDNCTRLFGEKHPQTLGFMNDLAILREQQGRNLEAGELYVKSLAGHLETFGPRSPKTLSVRGNLATFYATTGRPDEAESELLEIADVQRMELGAEHPDTIMTLNNLGFLYQTMNRLDEAEVQAAAAVSAARKSLDSASPVLQQMVNNLVMIQLELGKATECEQLLREMVDSSQTDFGNQSAEYCNQLCWLAICLIRQERFSEAERIARHSLEICNQINPTAWKTMHVTTVVGMALAGQKKLKQAEPLLLRGCRGMLASPGTASQPSRWLTRWSLEWLIRHFETTGSPAEAEHWKKRLQEFSDDKTKPGPKPVPK